MRLYTVHDRAAEGGREFLEGTLRAAQASARTFAKDSWHDIEIAEVEVKTDKQGFLAAFSGRLADLQILSTYRTWHLSPRGGLVEDVTTVTEAAQ